MAHNSSQVLMGSTRSSAREVSKHDSDPASFAAGSAVSIDSDGALSLLASAGSRIGISLGRSLSDHKKTAVLRTGEKVPILAELKRASGVITVSSYANLVSGTDDSVTVGATVFTAQAGAATPGDATFQAATSNAETAISLAAQINAHATASTLVYAVVTSSGVVTLYAKTAGVGSTGTGNDVAVAYTDNDTNVGITLSGLTGGKLAGGLNTVAGIDYATLGSKVYINATTGKADVAMTSYSVISDAIYSVSGALTGINEDGSEVPCVVADMPGGL